MYNLLNEKASDLMLDNSAEWDPQKIDAILPFHKQVILQIKPSICSSPDELVWLHTASGSYTAKSGYKSQAEVLATEEEPTPVGKQFAIRNIHLSSACPRCNELESVAHLLFTCSYAQEVWNLAPLASGFDPSTCITTGLGFEVFRRIPSLPPTGLGPGILSASICWNLWVSRNQLIFQQRTFTPEETLLKSIREAREWLVSQDNPIKPLPRPTCSAQDPPLDLNQTCMFTDAAWNPLTKCAGLAWIIDDAGSSSSYSATDNFVLSPLMAETLALRIAMTSALDRGITSLLILSDSQTLIKLVTSNGRHLEIASLLNDISILSNRFISVKFKFIPRLDNSRAGSVAKQALSLYQT